MRAAVEAVVVGMVVEAAVSTAAVSPAAELQEDVSWVFHEKEPHQSPLVAAVSS